MNDVLGRQDSDAFREQFQESFGTEMSALKDASKTNTRELFNKVGKLEVKTGSKTSIPAQAGLMSSKYFHGAIGIAVILIVIGFFRYIGDIDVASDASNLIKPSAVIPR